MRTLQACLLLLVFGGVAQAQSGRVYSTTVFPKPGEKFLEARHRIWLPEGNESLRGVIVHQHGCGRNGLSLPDDVHWQALARKHHCALLGTFYATGDTCAHWFEPKWGTERAFLTALADLARQSGRAELNAAPWVLWGHSGGAFWVNALLNRYPKRIVAVVARSGGELLTNASAKAVPVLYTYGANEKRPRCIGKQYFDGPRQEGAPWAIAPDSTADHDCRHSRLFVIPYLDACMTQRLPVKAGGTLRPMDAAQAWLGNADTREVASTKTYPGDPATACFLPDQATARRWQEFMRTGWVTDSTAPEKPPGQLRVVALGPNAVRLHWQAEADLESGIKTFIIYRDGQKIGQFTGPGDPYTKGSYQYANFGDEPVPEPLHRLSEAWSPPVMQFVDYRLRSGQTYRYQVSTVNHGGLESARSGYAAFSVTAKK